MIRLLKRSAIPAGLALAAATPVFAACPSVDKVNNNTIAQSTDISADFTGEALQ
jgi:hypothetical protein